MTTDKHPGNAPGSPTKVPLFGARKHATQLAERVHSLESSLARLGGMGAVQIAEEISSLRAEQARFKAEFDTEMESRARERDSRVAELQRLKDEIVTTQDEAILQEVGIYQYAHPLHDAVAFKDRLVRIQREIKAMARADGDAVHSSINWQVNNSAAQGRRMVRDISKLMLSLDPWTGLRTILVCEC